MFSHVHGNFNDRRTNKFTVNGKDFIQSIIEQNMAILYAGTKIQIKTNKIFI